MSWLLLAAAATGSSVFILALANAYLYASFRERFIKTWAFAWGVFSLRYLCMIAGLRWPGNLPLDAGYYLCIIASAVLLLNGTLQFVGRPALRWPAVTGTLIACWTLICLGEGWPLACLIVPVFCFLSLTDIFIGLQFLKLGGSIGPASRTVAWLFIAWGVHQADYPLLRPVAWFAPWGFLIGSLLALAIAIGMILGYLERTYRELQDKEERYRNLVESAHDWIWEVDADGRYRYASRQIREILGYAPEELIGLTPFDLMPAAEAARVGAIFSEISSGRRPFKGLENINLRKDGSPVVLETSGVPFFDCRGTFRGYRGMDRDITERRLSEDALRQSEEKHRTILQTAMDGFLLVDDRGRILEVNGSFCRMCGYSQAELLTMSISDLEACETPEDTAARIRVITAKGEARFESRHRCKDGRIIDVEASVKYRPIGEGRCVAFVRDITERKEAEAILRESEFFFKESQRAASIGSYKADFVADRWESSEVLDQIFGIDDHYRRDVPGWLEIVHPDDREALADYLREEVIAPGRRFSREYRIVRKNDGETRWVHGLGAVACDPNGAATTLIGTIQDITERKRAVAERDRLERQLLHTQKLESLGVLAGGIAHDFNNILTAITGNASIALLRLDEASPAAENIRKVTQSAARAAELARQMLAYSGRGKFVVDPLDLNALLQDTLHMLEVSISKKAALRLDLRNPLPAVEADATQLRQIVMNLVINASEAIGDQSGAITVATGTVDCTEGFLQEIWPTEPLEAGCYVFLEVTDTGCGMDRETLARIFDPFFTTKFTGRGLGMAAVQGIVRGHKGAIEVSSAPGSGTTFRVLLPSAHGPAQRPEQATASDGWRGTGKVLLVDDEEAVLGIGSEMLRELGFAAIGAGDGYQALEAFGSAGDIEWVILDLTMPQMDGEQCFDELRRLRPDLKILISSGYNEQEVSLRFQGKGVTGFLQKPYTFAMLREAFRALA